MSTVRISVVPEVPFPVEGVHYTVLAGDPQADDPVRVDGNTFRYFSVNPDPQPSPLVLSKTAFQDYAVSQLGGGTTGMSRFITIMDSTRDSASAAARFAFARYEAAVTFEKTNTETLTGVMVSGGCMTAEERTDILDNWPESAV